MSSEETISKAILDESSKIADYKGVINMDFDAVLWDRLAGEIALYVENFIISQNKNNKSSRFNIRPSYNVDYDISDALLKDIVNCESSEKYYVNIIAGSRNINLLPPHIKELVCNYLPQFFLAHPEYKNAECLKINED